MSKFGVPTEEQLDKINRLAPRPLSPEEVFVFSGKSAGDMLIPHRYIRISPELLKVMADDAKKGVSFMLNHNWSNWGGIQAVPYGKVFDGRVKKSDAEGETMALYLDKYIVRDDEIVDGVSANALIKKIETGVLSDTSIGWGTDTMICSICANNYYSSECRHYRGLKYEMGDGTQKLCTVTAMPPSVMLPQNNNALFEESIVWDGAYPGAVVTQAKHGDIIETPAGKFTVVQDKEELPEGTMFHGYYHNGDIVTFVKKSDPKKSISVSLADKKPAYTENAKPVEKFTQKGAESKMNENLKKMLETFGISYSEDEVINLKNDLLNQLAEKWATMPNDVPEADAQPETQAQDSAETFMTQEQVKEKLGKEYTAEEVLSLASEGIEYRKQLIDDAVAMGVRAMGNDFAAETWKSTFATMSTQAIKDIMRTWEAQAKAEIPAGRQTDPEAGLNLSKPSSLPDKAFKVGK